MIRALIVVIAAGITCSGLVGCEEEPPPPPSGVNTAERPVPDQPADAPGGGKAEVLKGGGDSGGVR